MVKFELDCSMIKCNSDESRICQWLDMIPDPFTCLECQYTNKQSIEFIMKGGEKVEK